MADNIRDAIVSRRRERIARMGYAEGIEVPRQRELPIVPFLQGNGLICEVKRRSPSKGDIAPGLDAVDQAGIYLRAGARNLSVLTEPTGFGGSLNDLMAIKRRFPEAAVLRKDFLIDANDVDVAWRAGADAVLLIAGMLTGEQLEIMYRCAKRLGMEALVEIHDDEDLAKARVVQPNLVGINSRDLTTFRIDPLLPVKVKAGIDWPARVVYESGITSAGGAAFATGAGFAGLLVGEGVVRNPALAGDLLEAMGRTRPAPFWPRIGRSLAVASGRPLVKICGIAREDDARMAADLGADVLGFVFWPGSPRCATPSLLRSLAGLDLPKVAVCVNEEGTPALPADVLGLLEDGLLDAVQFHGGETPDDVERLWPVGYKALRPATPEEAQSAAAFRCPRILLDAAADAPGGTGKRVAADILDGWPLPLWLAGGITPDNAARIVAARQPELVDLASGVEEKPGVKNPAALRKLFAELKNC